MREYLYFCTGKASKSEDNSRTCLCQPPCLSPTIQHEQRRLRQCLHFCPRTAVVNWAPHLRYIRLLGAYVCADVCRLKYADVCWLTYADVCCTCDISQLSTVPETYPTCRWRRQHALIRDPRQSAYVSIRQHTSAYLRYIRLAVDTANMH
jgi:hypothetical protein